VKGDTLAQNDLNLDSLEFNIDLPEEVNESTETDIGTVKKTTTTLDEKVFYASMEKYVNNPVNLDYEVLPVETIKGDPIKVNIINIPYDIKNILISQ